MAKKLNLSTAFIEMYTTLNDADKSTSIDYAVMAYALYNFNAQAWQKPFTTTVSFIAWSLNSKTNYVRTALKRLHKSQLLDIKPASTDEKRQQTTNVRQKIVITLGAKFNDYAAPNFNKQYNNNTQLTLVGGEQR